ncbi:MAG: outer membrane lipoprotein-sorting protein [Paludibacter sp.]|nr:outer membrane lipoprotein-sorting protein [Paludibacter sp.]
MRWSALVFCLMGCVAISTAQNFPSGKSVLEKVDQNMSAKTRISVSRMEISTARGSRTLEAKSYSEGDQNAFTEYLAPAREKGTKMLKTAQQLWIYSPSTDRVIQISGHMLRQSVMGSDLSYEDMMNDTPLLEQYAAVVDAAETINDRKCWVVTLNALSPEVSYARQKMWVDQERNIPLQIEMYSKSGKLLKRIELSDVKRVQGRWFPMTMLYRDMLKNGGGTRMTFLELQLDAVLPAGIFTKSSLK